MGSGGAGFWGRLTERQRAELWRVGTHTWFEPNEVILRQGESDRHLVVILTGYAKAVASLISGSERMLELCGPGTLIGELAALTAAPRSASIHALERVGALLINVVEFEGLARADPALHDHLVHTLAERLRLTNQRLTEASVPATLPRLAVLLASLSEQLGAGSNPLVLPISQVDLASLAATSEASVARAIRKLRTLGLVRTGRRKVVIVDPPALRRHADAFRA